MSNIIEIEDLNDPRVAIFSRLTEAQLRNRLEPDMGLFIAESPKVIAVALDAGYRPVSILTERKHILGQASDIIARCPDIPVYTGDSSLLASLTGYELTRGVLCAMRRPVLPQPSLLLQQLRRQGDRLRVVVVDGVVNATNIGTIFRGAAALNVAGVFLAPSCCDPLNRRSVRVSMGTVFQLPWCYLSSSVHEWPHPALDILHEAGFKTVAMALCDTAIRIDDPRLAAEPCLAIVMGAEGDGLSSEAVDGCSFVARIPMSNGVDSLNVAAAAAVAFWQLRTDV